MKGALKWVAGVASALVAVLLAALAAMRLRGEEERRQRELDKTIERHDRKQADARADIAREVAKGDAELAAAAARDRKQVDEAVKGGLADHLRKRNRAGRVRSEE